MTCLILSFEKKTFKFYFQDKLKAERWKHAIAKAAPHYRDIVDHYLLKEELGAGNFSTVYRALKVGTEEVVAVKVIAKHSLKDDYERSLVES